jgi:hypothetical protein
MCFSAGASFAAAAVLLGVGAVALRRVRSARELPFAAIPTLFAIQQLVEGVLWLSFAHDAPNLNVLATHVYSFFSHVLWPVYVPAAVWLIEPPGQRRRALVAVLMVGFAVGAFLLHELVDYPVVSQVTGSHIEYLTPPHYLAAASALYLVSTTASLMLSSHPWVRLFGVTALFSFGLAYAAYTTWFVSVWCYFAALLSVIVCVHMHRQPMLAASGAWPPWARTPR